MDTTIPPSKESTDPTDLDRTVGRRDFLRRGAKAAGAVAASVTAIGAAAGEAAAQEKDTKAAGGPPIPVLTPDGKLLHVDANGIHACPPADKKAIREGVPGKKWVMVIDLATCDGCGDCTRACSKMHFTPPTREWIKVFKMQDSPETPPYWFPKPCFQCDNPPCTKVCPVDATFKRQDGTVLIDNDRCIGCRFCMAACPYSTRYFNWGRPENSPEAQAHTYSPEWGFPRKVGTVEKCDFCPDLAAQGKLPPCVTDCPMGSIYYGDQNEDAVTNSKGQTERFSKLLKDRAAYRYMEELGTKPRVYYLPPKDRIYPAPGEESKDGHQHDK